MQSNQTHTDNCVSHYFSAGANMAVIDTNNIIDQVMTDALQQLSALTGLEQNQVIELLANKYAIQIEKPRQNNQSSLLNNDESQFIGQLFN